MTEAQTITEIETVVDDLTAHEFDICCELDTLGRDCDAPARWVMHKKPHCYYAATHPSLACDDCKDLRLMNQIGVTCLGCGAVFIDAADSYSLIEPIQGKH